MRFDIRVARVQIHIESVYPAIYHHCHAYEAEPLGKADISVRSDEESFSSFRRKMFPEAGDERGFPNLEMYYIHQQIAEAIVCFDTFLIHGAAVAVDGGAYLFCAPSGTGKTTHIRLWLEKLPGAFVVNGDKPFLRVTDRNVIAYGSPWCGKENMGTNTSVPLRAIIFMERSDSNRVQEASFSSVFPNLLQQTYRPESAEGMKKTLQLLKELPDKVRFYRFRFNNFKDDCFDVAYNALVRNER